MVWFNILSAGGGGRPLATLTNTWRREVSASPSAPIYTALTAAFTGPLTVVFTGTLTAAFTGPLTAVLLVHLQ